MRMFISLAIVTLLCAKLQGQTLLSAQLVDKQGEPVPFAHVVIDGTTVGSIANIRGEFAIAFDGQPANHQLKVSAIGYKTRLLPANQLPQKILMVEDVISLQQVVVVPRDYGRELIEKAVERIPANYAATEERLTGFLRELTYWQEKGKENPIYVAETIIESHKDSYQNTSKTGNVQILEGRDYISDQLADLNTRIYAGSHHPHRFDAIMRREAFLTRNKPYSFEVIDTLRLDGSDLFLVQVTGDGNRPDAEVWVQDSTFAISKLAFEYSEFNFLDKGRQILRYESTYDKGPDGRWRLIRTTYQTEFKKADGILVLNSEYITTNFRKAQEDIPFPKRVHFDDYLLYKTGSYDSTFWEGYTIMLTDEKLEQLFQRNADEKSSTDKKQSVEQSSRTFMDKLRYIFSVGLTPIAGNNSYLDFNNTQLNLQDSISSQSRNAFFLQTRIQYELGKDYFLGLNTNIPIGEMKNQLLELDLSRQVNLNPTGRPIYALPRIGIGYNLQTRSIGQYSSESFRISGKSFDSGETEISLATERIILNIGLGLAWKISGRNILFAEVSHPLSLQEKSGLYFEEKSEWWFPKSAFLNKQDANIQVLDNQHIFEQALTFSAGLILEF